MANRKRFGWSRTIPARCPFTPSSFCKSHLGNTTTVSDASSKATETISDGLGRVTSVIEDPGSSGHLNLTTNYGYDVLGDLTSVYKCSANGCGSGQSRTFAYDSLARMTQSTNPESGTVTYSYVGSSPQSTLQSRTDARASNPKTTYTYDALNRLKSVTYADGTPSLSYNV